MTDVQVLSRYIVDLEFADGTRKVIDLEPHLWGEMFAPLLDDYALFRRVHVDGRAGTIVSPNGADLPTDAVRAGQGVGALLIRGEHTVGRSSAPS